MRRTIGSLVMVSTLAAALAGCAAGYGRQATFCVKALAVDQEARRITALLVAHSAEVEAELVADEAEIRVEVGEFYEARFVPGVVGTTKRNLLRVEVPGGEPALFRLRTVRFLT